jgi:hypothetical protein
LKWVFLNIGISGKNFRAKKKKLQAQRFQREVPPMIPHCAANDGFEISARFRRTVESRIERLERDADRDEAQVSTLVDGDHIRRHMRLVAVQRSESLRMQLFLARAKDRLPRPMIAL